MSPLALILPQVFRGEIRRGNSFVPRHSGQQPHIIKEVVLLGLPHVMTTLHNRLPGSEGSLRGFLPSCNCLTGSQLLASAGVSSSLTQSRLDFHPPHLPSVYSTTTIYRHLPPYEGARTGPL
ncbi:hypothetical protein BHE90_016277 [Fusarium euwallaceae]|uniref:Uncharacterized protein n=1 Tax=Fusarium euwallaceae TaxID=1147111 RepID=A0A430L0T0_9HYPO|nr:hypothetical protein BHE90_016277 [Fusarium euwallaceae]